VNVRATFFAREMFDPSPAVRRVRNAVPASAGRHRIRERYATPVMQATAAFALGSSLVVFEPTVRAEVGGPVISRSVNESVHPKKARRFASDTVVDTHVKLSAPKVLAFRKLAVPRRATPRAHTNLAID
jgi:hypothetical protein